MSLPLTLHRNIIRGSGDDVCGETLLPLVQTLGASVKPRFRATAEPSRRPSSSPSTRRSTINNRTHPHSHTCNLGLIRFVHFDHHKVSSNPSLKNQPHIPSPPPCLSNTPRPRSPNTKTRSPCSSLSTTVSTILPVCCFYYITSQMAAVHPQSINNKHARVAAVNTFLHKPPNSVPW